MTENQIPDDILIRTPLMRPEWMDNYRRLGEHECAPRWNSRCGDRLTAGDLAFVRAFGASLESGRAARDPVRPGDEIIRWILETAKRSDWFAEKTAGLELPRDFLKIPVMRREDIQFPGLADVVPRDADLSRIVVNPTAGTTGTPIPAPSHPRAVGCYDPLVQFALRRHGLKAAYGPGTVAAIQLCAQKNTITYYTVHSVLDGAGFAKINLEPSNWRGAGHPDAYIRAMKPVFLSGDPFSFYTYMRMGGGYRPQALLTTAITLEPALRKDLESYFQCPVADLYSLNETGPLAYSCPADPGQFHVLPADIHAEILDDDGAPAGNGKRGAIAVTGGRNPYLPLLRYLTTDTAVLDSAPCPCGDPMPRLKGLEARKMVYFLAPDGWPVNPLDIARIVRRYPVLRFQFIQEENLNCVLRVQGFPAVDPPAQAGMREQISRLFGGRVGIDVTCDLETDGRKAVPFICNAKK